MMKIKIVQDGVKGSDDGATVRVYPMDGGPDGDGVYNVSDDLGQAFIDGGEAEEIGGESRPKRGRPPKVAPAGGIPGLPTAGENDGKSPTGDNGGSAPGAGEQNDGKSPTGDGSTPAPEATTPPTGIPGFPPIPGQ